MYVTWLIYICHVTHFYPQQADLRMPTLILTYAMPPSICDMTPSYMRHDSFMYMTWLIHVCDMTPLYMSRDSFSHTASGFAHAYSDLDLQWESHDSFMCVTWLIHVCDMTHLYLWRHSFFTHSKRTSACLLWSGSTNNQQRFVGSSSTPRCSGFVCCVLWQYDAACCSVSQYVTVCCSVLFYEKSMMLCWLLFCAWLPMFHLL